MILTVGGIYFTSMSPAKLMKHYLLVYILSQWDSLEPVMHFEEVIDYRVGQVVLHSTQ